MSDSIDRTLAIATLVVAKETGSLMCKELKGVIEVLNRMPPAQQWIPCSERLPENGYWLWSAKGGEVQKDFYWDGHWENAEKYGYEVMAWMPMPEPYKGG